MHAKMVFLSFLQTIAQILVLVSSAATSDIRYVRPADSPLSSCPGQPCLTLHEYVEIDNFTSGTTLQFLSGNHTLQQSFLLVNISNVTFEAVFNHSVTNIICNDNVTIHSIRVIHLNIVGLSFILSQSDRSALWFSSCKSVFISNTAFQGSGEVTGRAIRVYYTEVIITMCVFKWLTVTNRLRGGAIYSIGTNLTIHRSSFVNNAADYGGAIYASKSILTLNETYYYCNSAQTRGGAINCYQSQVDIVGNNTFINNSCRVTGGAMRCHQSQLNIIHGIACFYLNEAKFGGAMYLRLSDTLFIGSVTMLKNKAVRDGGALFIGERNRLNATSTINVTCLTLKENAARREGGAMYVSKGNAILHGNVTIESNTAKIGGGISAVESFIHVAGFCSFTRNNATYGGAVNTLYSTVSIQGPTQFAHNTAADGGALYADGSKIQILEEVNFSFNSAKNGGAMFLNGASIQLSDCNHVPLITSSFNKARQDGGVIYSTDSPSLTQCYYRSKLYNERYPKLPHCFLQFQHYSTCYPAIVSRNDSAEREGNFMFGGLMDRCKLLYTKKHTIGNAISIYPGSRPTAKEISSQPYSLCLCINFYRSVCTRLKVMHVEVYRGQKVFVPLLAKTQYGNTVTNITAITSSTARLETYQTSQPLPDYCAPLSYTVYSNVGHEQVHGAVS